VKGFFVFGRLRRLIRCGAVEFVRCIMHQNNTVYKGYRLSARIERPAPTRDGSPKFAASILVGIASSETADAHSYQVPRFAHGGFVVSPNEAVHAAILFGRQVVDDLQAKSREPVRDKHMSKADELRMAMQRWHQAHSEVMDFYERNDVMDPKACASWVRLREIENQARMHTEDLVGEALKEDGN
jgi:hypothetical protein